MEEKSRIFASAPFGLYIIKVISKCFKQQWGWINSLCKQASTYFVCVHTSQVYNNFSI